MKNKTWIVLQREYLTRVKKKSFIVMTLLMPLLLLLFMIAPILLNKIDSKEVRKIAVVDQSGLFLNTFKESDELKFHYEPVDKLDELKADVKKADYYALLQVPGNVYTSNRAILFSNRQVTADVEDGIRKQMERIMTKDKRDKMIADLKIPDLEQRFNNTFTTVKLNSVKISEGGKTAKGSSGLANAIGFATGILIYMFLIMFGQMVMMSIMEEKTNRIVEVIVSSVKPFQLLVGKIVGVAFVGLTQIVLWVVLSTAILFGVKSYFTVSNADMQATQDLMAQTSPMGGQTAQIDNKAMAEIFEVIEGIDFTTIIGAFIIFFIGGYLLYSSLFGAVGAAVDAQEDANQFMMPIMMPIFISFMIMVLVVKNPDGPLALWGSIIPFTSPIVMMARIPFGVPMWQMILSISVLMLSIVGAIWMASKIYRTGILMYGKKITWKELFKWVRYKNY